MTMLESPEQARRFVRYWAAEGATWLKAYTNIRTQELTAAIDEAHQQGIKVTGHLCSISFTEAVALGIDNIEHGLATNSDYSEGRGQDECPGNLWDDAVAVDVNGPEAQATFQAMIDAGVAMTSTLAVYELFIQGPSPLGTRARWRPCHPPCARTTWRPRPRSTRSGAPSPNSSTPWRMRRRSTTRAACSQPE